MSEVGEVGEYSAIFTFSPRSLHHSSNAGGWQDYNPQHERDLDSKLFGSGAGVVVVDFQAMSGSGAVRRKNMFVDNSQEVVNE